MHEDEVRCSNCGKCEVQRDLGLKFLVLGKIVIPVPQVQKTWNRTCSASQYIPKSTEGVGCPAHEFTPRQ